MVRYPVQDAYKIALKARLYDIRWTRRKALVNTFMLLNQESTQIRLKLRYLPERQSGALEQVEPTVDN